MIEVGIVIVNYNSFDDVERCLGSLNNLEGPTFRIIIVDSKSPDDSGIRIRDEFGSREDVTVILNTENSGFAGANNIGMKYAKCLGVDFIWLLNADTTVDPQSLKVLVEEAKHDREIGALGSKVFYGNSQGKIWSAGASIDFSKQEITMRGWGEEDAGQFDQKVECDYLPGCSLFFPVSTLERVGYMPEEYFMYFEETDWCRKIKSAGLKLIYIPESIVWHFFEDEKMQGAFGVYYYNRNQRVFWSRFGKSSHRVFGYISAIFRELPRALWAYLFSKNREQRQVFFAHIVSITDFVFRRMGRRYSSQLSR